MAQRCNHIRKKQKPSFNGKDHLKLLLSQMGNKITNKPYENNIENKNDFKECLKFKQELSIQTL